MKRICLLLFFKFVLCVPPDYCLQPLNRSDCKMEPVPVFSYYKPGSRCEIQMWKGCPTQNKFSDQFECTYICIKRSTVKEEIIDEEETALDGFDTPQYCLHNLNPKHCGRKFEIVYTFVPEVKQCEWTPWFSCDTQNKFKDEASCYSACTGKQHHEKPQEDELHKFMDNLNKMTEDQLHEVIDVINNEIEPRKVIIFTTQFDKLISTDKTEPVGTTDKIKPVVTTERNTDKTTSSVTDGETTDYYDGIDFNQMSTDGTGTLDDVVVLDY